MSKENKNKEKEEIKVENEAAPEAVNEETSAEETNEVDEEEKDPVAELTEQLAEYKDKYLRSVAEFDNYRKHTLKEKAELILNGGEKTIVAILPVIDDMERAIANNSKSDDIEAIKEGFNLIHQKFLKILEGMGVKQIDTTDADFDTEFHNAIAMLPMGEEKKGKVIDCVKTGYTLNNKVIRHCDVAVGE